MSSSKSKTTRKKTAPYSEDSLRQALKDIREKKASVRQVCSDYGIPKSTVLDRIHGKTTDSKKKRGPDPVLGIEGEKKVVQWLIDIAKCGFPVKKQELLDSVQKILKDTNSNKFKDNRPGQTWYTNFLKRHPEISCRSAEGINKARAQVTEESIRHWFRGLETYLEDINQRDILDRPASIFNGDESGFALCPKTGKVLGPRGFRNLYEIKQGNEKDNLTVLITFNANGDLCPPCVVFPYIRPPRAVVESMPADWCLGRSESGWMRGDVFFEYVTNEFNNWVENNNIQKPVLLLVDGHKSHMSLMLSVMCEQMQIILYALPPNTTHILQPADVSVFAPLKASWKNTVRKFLTKEENVNTSVTKTNFCNLLAETLQNTDLPSHIKNGFRRCGLYPFDPNAPDYTKCVLNTLENLNSRQTHTNKDISRSDIATTKKVLKQIKTALKDKNINVRVIFKELNILRKSLPAETNISGVSIDMESDCTNIDSSHHISAELRSPRPSNSTSINLSKSVDISAKVQEIPHDFELCADTEEGIESAVYLREDGNSISSLHLTGSYLEVGSIVSLDDILIMPLDVTEIEPISSNPMIVHEKNTQLKSAVLVPTPGSSNLVTMPEKLTQLKSAEVLASTPGSTNKATVTEKLTQLKSAEVLVSTPGSSNGVTVTEKLTQLKSAEVLVSTLGSSNPVVVTEKLTQLKTAEVLASTPGSTNKATVTEKLTQLKSAEVLVSTPGSSNGATVTEKLTQLKSAEVLVSTLVSSNPVVVTEKLTQLKTAESQTLTPESPTPVIARENLTQLKTAEGSASTPDSSNPVAPENLTETKSFLLNDPFERHLYLPIKPEKVIKPNKYKTPAAISSAAWREHYEVRERAKNLKQEETRKRKIERGEKQQQAKILKESNRKKKIGLKMQSRRNNSKDTDYQPRTRSGRKENRAAPSAAAGKISCSECDGELVSDVDDDEDKNIGCDVCPRWYHLKCTAFIGQVFLEVKDKPYKCDLCG